MISKQNRTKKGSVLVVDDTLANLRILNVMLTECGYKVRLAPNGPLALQSAQATLPDVILLDIMMPGMNGYDVCQKLKADEATRGIPVLFISALGETMDKVLAYSVGGIDYITKPFQLEEVLARVNTHITIARLQKRLQEQVAELDAFAHTVAHNLKNPLSIINTSQQLLAEDINLGRTDNQPEILSAIQRATHKAINLVDELLLLATIRKEEVELTPLDMAHTVSQVLQRLKWTITAQAGEITQPDHWPMAVGYSPWIEEVWMNYISNGLKYGGQPPRLELGATPQPNGKIRFWVRDNGPGINPEMQPALFTEFTRLEQLNTTGYGLGLSIVRRIMDKLGQETGMESEVGHGSLFYFTLPAP
jgi:signal transduction histidine kinase